MKTGSSQIIFQKDAHFPGRIWSPGCTENSFLVNKNICSKIVCMPSFALTRRCVWRHIYRCVCVCVLSVSSLLFQQDFSLLLLHLLQICVLLGEQKSPSLRFSLEGPFSSTNTYTNTNTHPHCQGESTHCSTEKRHKFKRLMLE